MYHDMTADGAGVGAGVDWPQTAQAPDQRAAPGQASGGACRQKAQDVPQVEQHGGSVGCGLRGWACAGRVGLFPPRGGGAGRGRRARRCRSLVHACGPRRCDTTTASRPQLPGERHGRHQARHLEDAAVYARRPRPQPQRQHASCPARPTPRKPAAALAFLHGIFPLCARRANPLASSPGVPPAHACCTRAYPGAHPEAAHCHQPSSRVRDEPDP